MPKIHHPVRLAKAFCSTKTFSRCALYAWNLEPQALCYEMQVDAPGRWGLHTYISFHAHHLCIHFLPCSCTFALMSCPLNSLDILWHSFVSWSFHFCPDFFALWFLHSFPAISVSLAVSFPGFSFIAFEGKAHRKTKSGWNPSQCPLQNALSFHFSLIELIHFLLFLRQLLHSCPFMFLSFFYFFDFFDFFAFQVVYGESEVQLHYKIRMERVSTTKYTSVFCPLIFAFLHVIPFASCNFVLNIYKFENDT